MLLEGRVAIVSGVGPGMGRSIALRLAGEGADVVLAARSIEKLDEVGSEVEALGRRATRIPTDLAQPDACRQLVDRTLEAHGRLDVLVNNAFHPGTMTRFESDDLEKGWRDTLEVNLYGSLRVSQAAVPAMKAAGGGSIVMINTMSTRVVNPGYAAYAASKAALEAATRGMAKELGADQIRVNSVMPGYIWGAAVEAHFERQAKSRGISKEEAIGEITRDIPLGRIPHSDEISGAVIFFASDLSSCITGQSLDVNGGHVMV